MQPVIAIPQMGRDLFRRYMKSKYGYALAHSGARAVWIELEDAQQAVQQALACDGLLLPGGADIAPALYGQARTGACGEPHLLRDAAEPLLFRAFLQAGKPVLGICRGMQMINVCMGGTLLQDISGLQRCRHSDFGTRARSAHSCTLTPGSRLAAILGADALPVNSLHHQAVDRLGQGLVAAATSEDGFVEGLELPGAAFCLGVQWHPEHMYRKAPAQRRIFQAFVEAARRGAAAPGAGSCPMRKTSLSSPECCGENRNPSPENPLGRPGAKTP